MIGLLWHVLVVDGFSVAWRVGLMAALFLIVGIILLVLCYKLLFRSGKLKSDLHHKLDYFLERTILGSWVLLVPSLSVALGALFGAWWAGSVLIEQEKLGERLGQLTFKAITVSVAAANMKDSKYTQAQLVEALIKGEQKISVVKLQTFSSHHLGEVSMAQVEKVLPIAADGKVHGGTVWVLEKTMDTVAYYQLSGEGDLVYKLAKNVAAHDLATDNDGQVTVQEISDVACTTFLNKGMTRLLALLMLEIVSPVFLVLLVVLAGPPGFCWFTRAIVEWRKSRAKSAL